MPVFLDIKYINFLIEILHVKQAANQKVIPLTDPLDTKCVCFCVHFIRIKHRNFYMISLAQSVSRSCKGVP